MGKRHVRALNVALAGALALAAAAQAHEIGTTQVHALFLRNHTYRIEIVSAPRSLLNKLEATARRPRSPADLPIGVLEERLNALRPQLLQSIEMSFAEPNPERGGRVGGSRGVNGAIRIGENSTTVVRPDLVPVQNDRDLLGGVTSYAFDVAAPLTPRLPPARTRSGLTFAASSSKCTTSP